MENNEKKNHSLIDLMDASMSKIREMVDSNTIIGEPIQTPDGVTLIPVSLYRQSGVLSAGTYAEDANGVYVLKGEGLTVPYVTYDGKDSVHFFSVPDTYTYQRISDIPTYINVEKP